LKIEGATIIWHKKQPPRDCYPVLEFTESGDDPQAKVLKGPINQGESSKPKWSWTCDFYIEDDSSGQGMHGDTVRILIYEGQSNLIGATRSFTLSELVRPDSFPLVLYSQAAAVGSVMMKAI